MKFFTWLFNFADDYYKFQESYEKSRYPFFRFLLLIVTAAIPSLITWGITSIKITSGAGILGLIFLIVLGISAFIKTPKDLFLLSLVAFGHGIWILMTRKKVQTPVEENVETPTKKKKRSVKWEKSDSNPAWDFILGTLGLILSVASIILPFVILAHGLTKPR